MVYLQAVVKESMRVKPPVTMVPYKATRAFPISDDYTVPANSMVIPSFFNSLHDSVVYPEPEKFTPERWLDPSSSANTNPKNYLVFWLWASSLHWTRIRYHQHRFGVSHCCGHDGLGT